MQTVNPCASYSNVMLFFYFKSRIKPSDNSKLLPLKR